MTPCWFFLCPYMDVLCMLQAGSLWYSEGVRLCWGQPRLGGRHWFYVWEPIMVTSTWTTVTSQCTTELYWALNANLKCNHWDSNVSLVLKCTNISSTQPEWSSVIWDHQVDPQTFMTAHPAVVEISFRWLCLYLLKMSNVKQPPSSCFYCTTEQVEEERGGS